jgi:hypothetical protein
VTQHGLGLVHADPVRAGIQQHRQRQVGQRPGRTMAVRRHSGLRLKAWPTWLGFDGRLALVEHAHIAAQGQRTEHELGVVGRALAAPQHAAEAHREAQHLHAAGHGHAVVAVFVHDDQHAQRQQEGQHGGDHAASSCITWRAATRRACGRVRAGRPACGLGPKPGCSRSMVRALTL